MTEKEKKAINNLKEIIELVEEELKNNNKNTNAVLDIIDLKSLDTVLNLINRLQKENEQKDKQIDLMTERIEWLCKSNGILLDIEHGENFNQKDIKQYFEKQANEKGE